MSKAWHPITLKQLEKIALFGGAIARTYFTHFGIERIRKEDTTPLTVADTEINRLVIERVRNISGEIDIVGEEESCRRESAWQLLCDPIDGTYPFTWGMPNFTCMIALMYEHQPVMGVIYDPIMDRMYSAEKGKGAYMNGQRLQVSSICRPDEEPIVGYTSWRKCGFRIYRVADYLQEKYGMRCQNLCTVGYLDMAVANGEFAGMIFPGTNHHDTAPGHIIVEEAGGFVTDMHGYPIDYRHEKTMGHIASNGKMHDLLVAAVHKYG